MKKDGTTSWSERDPVFNTAVARAMTKEGIYNLATMQHADGGWGWFGREEKLSDPHSTALVVHGLLIAQECGVSAGQDFCEAGVKWLENYQARSIRVLASAAPDDSWKPSASNIDAFVYMVLNDAGTATDDMKVMKEFLCRDRNMISVYAKAMYGLTLLNAEDKPKLDMILRNISQYLVQDDENQTAYLKLAEPWWYWYGSDIEAMAYYLKLLSKTDPKGETASRLAKYLINNRKHAIYWNSTRDTALVIEAFADFIKASGENMPDLSLTISLDGKTRKQVKITPDTLFSFDNKLVLTGTEVQGGIHTLEVSKEGTGPLYFNAYITYFTLENPIKKTGLEIKVQRQIYKLVPADQKAKVPGSRGQALDQMVEKYDRQLLADGATLKSGDLVEVELEIDSKNDYEFLLFEDPKAAGCEAVDLQSGYNGNDLDAYMELHDERVCFFVRALARGKHSVSYRLRAEVPGVFSACLPGQAQCMPRNLRPTATKINCGSLTDRNDNPFYDE